MDPEIYQIGTDGAERKARCAKLQQFGQKLTDEGNTEAVFNIGQLSGMNGVEEFKNAYLCIRQLYSMLGGLAVTDAERMTKIAEAFDQLDSSASVDAMTW